MKWIARVLVFATALIFGTFAASLFAANQTTITDDVVAPVQLDFEYSCKHFAVNKTPITAEDLLGTWRGTWGHNDGDCTLDIDRIEGNAFYGTLRKEGAVVRFTGTFAPKTRTLRFDETKVVSLGAQMSEWSLGKNFGFISPDGRTLVGTGHDKWGQYAWAASSY